MTQTTDGTDARLLIADAFEEFAALLHDSSRAALNARRMEASTTFGITARRANEVARKLRDQVTEEGQ